jgi:phosphate transport system substrate-binding protein
VPVRRGDASGDTFHFTAFLTAANADWRDGPAYSTTVTWPAVSRELTASGTQAVVQVCGQTPGCIAYVGVSARSQAVSAGLGEARLRNRAGKFQRPTPAAIAAASTVPSRASIRGDLRASLVDQDGAEGYPIVNYEYLMVRSRQPDADTALAVRTFLTWAIDGGGGSSPANLQAAGFAGLPTAILPRVTAAIARVET